MLVLMAVIDGHDDSVNRSLSFGEWQSSIESYTGTFCRVHGNAAAKFKHHQLMHIPRMAETNGVFTALPLERMLNNYKEAGTSCATTDVFEKSVLTKLVAHQINVLQSEDQFKTCDRLLASCKKADSRLLSLLPGSAIAQEALWSRKVC